MSSASIQPVNSSIIINQIQNNNNNNKDPESSIQQNESKEVKSNKLITLYLVRHGERLDAVPGNNFLQVCGNNWFNPPLTEIGKAQAKAAAKLLKSHLHGSYTIDND